MSQNVLGSLRRIFRGQRVRWAQERSKEPQVESAAFQWITRFLVCVIECQMGLRDFHGASKDYKGCLRGLRYDPGAPSETASTSVRMYPKIPFECTAFIKYHVWVNRSTIY